MISRQDVCLRRLADDRAQEVQFGRWLANDKVTPDALLANAYARTAAASAGRHVQAIQDTSELNYQAHVGRVSGLGIVGNGSDVGLFVHPLLAVDADNGVCLGLAHLHQWNRMAKADPHYQRLPIEDKESYRWLQVAQAGKQCLREAAMVTVMADRESDIYEEWTRLPDERTHLLTRACHDRNLAAEGHAEVGDSGFLGRDLEDGVLDDVDFRAGLVQALAQLGHGTDTQTGVVHHDEERGGVKPGDVFVGDELFFRAHGS